jgi:hypothetical protein
MYTESSAHITHSNLLGTIMKKLINRTLSLSLPVLGAMFFFSTPAQANEEQGVQCPAGYAAEISDANRLLKCSALKTYTLPSICPGAYAMDSNNQDRCNPLVAGATIPSVMGVRPPNYPNVPYTRQIHQSQPDSFVATVREYAFPVGGYPYLLGDKTKGVRCPSGYDGDRSFNGNGIRCDKDSGSPKLADCDFPWGLSRDHNNGNRDKCVGPSTGETKPAGITNAQLQVEQLLGDTKWILTVNNGADTWQKRNFAFPSHIN